MLYSFFHVGINYLKHCIDILRFFNVLHEFASTFVSTMDYDLY